MHLQNCKSDYYLHHVCSFFHLSAWNSSAPTGQIFMKFYIWGFSKYLLKRFQVWLKSDKKWTLHMSTYVHLIYKDECLFVCLFVPYTKPHFWTDWNQTLHTSPPWSGRDRRVCMGPQYFNFSTSSTYFVGSGCRFVCSRWLPAPYCPATALYPCCGVCWYDVRDGGELCNENTEKWMACVWKW